MKWAVTVIFSTYCCRHCKYIVIYFPVLQKLHQAKWVEKNSAFGISLNLLWMEKCATCISDFLPKKKEEISMYLNHGIIKDNQLPLLISYFISLFIPARMNRNTGALHKISQHPTRDFIDSWTILWGVNWRNAWRKRKKLRLVFLSGLSCIFL